MVRIAPSFRRTPTHALKRLESAEPAALAEVGRLSIAGGDGASADVLADWRCS